MSDRTLSHILKLTNANCNEIGATWPKDVQSAIDSAEVMTYLTTYETERVVINNGINYTIKLPIFTLFDFCEHHIKVPPPYTFLPDGTP
jgi:hypothetical protein